MDHIRMWHQDASNSSDGLPVISGSQVEPCPQGCPQGFSLKKRKKGEAGKGHFFQGKALGTNEKGKHSLIKSRNWKIKEDNICQKSRQDSGLPRDSSSFSCLIQISRALLESRRICLPSLKKPIRRPETNRNFWLLLLDCSGGSRRSDGGKGGSSRLWGNAGVRSQKKFLS